MGTETELKQRFKGAQFMLSTPELATVPSDFGYELAFAGRSNAGKSSAINALTEHTQLARVSKTPGRTQHLVFFDLGKDRRLVDLPGYGYAKVPEAIRAQWRGFINGYLQNRESLQALVLMMDIRVPMTPFDLTMLEFAQARQLPVQILLTKADKLNRGPGLTVLQKVKKLLQEQSFTAEIELFSAHSGLGVQAIRWKLAHFLKLA